MKAIEQYFPVVLFIMLSVKVVLFFDSVAEILKCDHSSERYGTFLSRSAVCFSVYINVLLFISVPSSCSSPPSS